MAIWKLVLNNIAMYRMSGSKYAKTEIDAN
jgi:hypothetical protein